MIESLIDSFILEKLKKISTAHKVEFILVGGMPRDILGKFPVKFDFDIEVWPKDFQVVSEDWIGPIFKVIEREFPKTDVLRFNIIRVHVEKKEFEFSPPRREFYIKDSEVRHDGFEVKFSPIGSFKEAWMRRDFTINSIGINLLTEEVIDPFGGREDLRRRILKSKNPDFHLDPVRLLRAIRFEISKKFSVSDELLKKMYKCDLTNLSHFYLAKEAAKSGQISLFFRKFLKVNLKSSKPHTKYFEAIEKVSKLELLSEGDILEELRERKNESVRQLFDISKNLLR